MRRIPDKNKDMGKEEEIHSSYLYIYRNTDGYDDTLKLYAPILTVTTASTETTVIYIDFGHYVCQYLL